MPQGQVNDIKSPYLLDRYTDEERRDVIGFAIKNDQDALDSLRVTYKTGKPVVLSENAHNSRHWIQEGNISSGYTPLNTLGHFTVKYDKDKNEMKYWDYYDFNRFEDFVPGRPFTIKGNIKLSK